MSRQSSRVKSLLRVWCKEPWLWSPRARIWTPGMPDKRRSAEQRRGKPSSPRQAPSTESGSFFLLSFFLRKGRGHSWVWALLSVIIVFSVSVDSEKAFDRIQHPLLMKSLGRLRIGGDEKGASSVKRQPHTPPLTSYLVVKRLAPYPLGSGTEYNCPLLLFVVPEVLAISLRQEKRNGRHSAWKKSRTAFMHRWHDCLWRKSNDISSKATTTNQWV